MNKIGDQPYLSALPIAWQKAIGGRRAMPHYKPAALLTFLDMLENGEAPSGQFEFELFDRRFEQRLQSFDEKGSRRGWEPFLHLSIGDHVWQLYKGSTPADVPLFKPNKSKSYVLSYADKAILSPELLSFVQSDAGRAAVRYAIYELLSHDRASGSKQLLQQEASGFGVGTILSDLVPEFEIGAIYDRRRDIHGKFGGTGPRWNFNASEGQGNFPFHWRVGKQLWLPRWLEFRWCISLYR